MAVSRKVRFEVFKRDKFTCQYCGKSAPDVVLNADHIEPRSKGGNDSPLNLITSCFDCNQGKKATPLSDNTVIAKQKAQLDLLQERREQIEMMMEWQKGLLDFNTEVVTRIAKYWDELTPGYYVNDHGLDNLRKLLKQFSTEEIVAAMNRASDYLKYDDGELTHESVNDASSKIKMFCVVTRRSKSNPHIQQMYYIRGILRKRLNYINEFQIMDVLQYAIDAGIDVGWITWASKQARSYSHFRTLLNDAIDTVEEPEE